MRIELCDNMAQVASVKGMADFCLSLYDKTEMYRESSFVVLLNSANKIIGHYLLSVGGLDSCAFDVRIVAKAALLADATRVVLCHNHPSGNPAPSQSDIRQTEQVKNALKLFNIVLLDHIVLAENSFFSFADDRTINF
jgi:DNA repair protein RadC